MKRKISIVKKAACFTIAMLFVIHPYCQTLDVGSGTTIIVPSGTYIMTGGGVKIESTTGAIDNNGTIKLAGDWINNGSGLINGSAGTVALNGSSAEVIGGSAATTFNNLTITNGSTVNNNVSISSNETVSGTLSFTNGSIVTRSNSLIIPSSGSISGASLTTGWVNGNLERDLATNSGTQSFKYELGDSTIYTPVTLDIRNADISGGSVNITGYIASADANENVPSSNASGIDQLQKSNRYWFMNKSGAGSFDSYDITLDASNTTNSGTPGGSITGYAVKKFDSSTNWISTTSSIIGSTIKATGLNTFSDFEIGVSAGGTLTFSTNLFIQGYYLGAGKMSPLLKLLNLSSNATDVDTATIELRTAAASSIIAYSYKGILQSNGNLTCTFDSTAAGDYYIVIKQRNSLETWSANPVTISNGGNYDFTTPAGQSYGAMANLGGVYGIYSGDVTQDGSITSSDKTNLQSVLPSFLIGTYNVNDITGDGFVDEDDLRILQNNLPLNLSSQHP